ncbi:hypothetical protein MLD38_005711 [Melastoma candidum]|uniref:Uncharacterized protein n=1 Tax=Melastoma candidum TaxID=119954 RepID=A0ACB9RKK1_9MYRT|nr:hypothetical protein MLD38_005711 [Melastoma candidum]
MTTAADATPVEVLQHATSFASEVLSQPDLRSRLLSVFRSRLSPSASTASLKPLNLAAETLENAISTNNTSIRSSSLRFAEKLLLSHKENAFSSFLLCLIYSLCDLPRNAAASLLELFCLDPLLARSEVAPGVFEELFLVHLVPVLEWFNERRSKVLSLTGPSSFPLNDANYDDASCDLSVVLPYNKVLSKMSGDQARKLKELEDDYENAINENCKVFANYFKDMLLQKDGSRSISPPEVVLENSSGYERTEKMEEGTSSESWEIGVKNGRYNPIWAEGEKSIECNILSRSSKPKSPPSYPQRVSADILREDEEENRRMPLFEPVEKQRPEGKQSSVTESNSGTPDQVMTNYKNPPVGGKHTAPKDFVCPITSNLFHDPVTLETGQTYERRAIQEWIDRGNLTCPITRQKLHSTQLPKTNYVLKRLIASWQELNPGSLPSHSEYSTSQEIPPFQKAITALTSPNSVISQANIDGSVGQLKNDINKLCMSDILEESEMAVLRIEQFWQEANLEAEIQSKLTKPPVVNGFVEILFNSVDPRVLKATVFLLCELGSREKSVIHTLTQVDSDVDAIVSLFKKGLLEAVVLIYLLRLSTNSLVAMDLVDAILTAIRANNDGVLNMCIKPRTAAMLLLAQILGSSEEAVCTSITSMVLSARAVDDVMKSLEAEWAEERIAAVSTLLKCMQEDGKCRNRIANEAELAPILECFAAASDVERLEIVHFLSELIRSNRRTFNKQVLHVIKDEGAFSTMHTLLSYLQTAPHDQCPVVAGLLLHLDLLAEPRKMSIYREEAIDALISCLRNTDFPAAQISAAETLVALQGRFSASGKPLNRAFLLKHAGLDKRFRTIVRMEQFGSASVDFDENRDEEKAANEWERKMAYALVSHEFGLLFEALADGLKSRYAELCSPCFISATWLTHMLSVLPDTGIRGAARVCLLRRFVSIFKSARDVEDRALSMLALNSFIQDSEGLRDLTPSMKDVLKGLRELKKYSPLAFEMLKVLSEGNESSVHDMWNHKEITQVDCGSNGEVLSIVCFGDKIFSGHSDGTIKVWTGKGTILRLIQEVREHTKGVTSLVAPQSGDRLHSGSLDKTIRVWSIGNDGLQCLQVHDMKDHVQSLVVSGSTACFIPQGAGVKVHSWNKGSKLLNANKHVKCLSLAHGRLYCGSYDNSIQEIDLASGTLSNIQSGSRKLLGKSNPIQALEVHDGLIYSASHSLDGAAVKIWSGSNYGMVGTLGTTGDVRAMAVSTELVYLGCKGGGVEVWCKEKNNRVETLHCSATNGKVQCMAIDDDEEILVIGTSDGKIQAWGLT